MNPVVVDASALGAIVFEEPSGAQVWPRLQGVTVCAPTLLKFELANIAVTKSRRHPESTEQFFSALALVIDERTDIVWHDVPATDVALMARATGLSAYDASYLWLAGMLDADLVTLDTKLAAAIEE
jgi:predicted nucleic acid-binding protein